MTIAQCTKCGHIQSVNSDLICASCVEVFGSIKEIRLNFENHWKSGHRHCMLLGFQWGVDDYTMTRRFFECMILNFVFKLSWMGEKTSELKAAMIINKRSLAWIYNLVNKPPPR